VPDFGKMQSMEAIGAVDTWARDDASGRVEAS
jgi:hypothetical protein